MLGKVQGGSRRPVGLGAWGAAPAAAVKKGNKIKRERREERGARLSQA